LMGTNDVRTVARSTIGEFEVSKIGLGIVGSPDVVRRAFEQGVNLFFISVDLHWPLYEAARRGIVSLLASGVPRSDVVIAGITYITHPRLCSAGYDELLRAMPDLGHIDVGVMGILGADAFAGQLDTFMRLRDGVNPAFRAIGAFAHDEIAARLALLSGMLDLVAISHRPDSRAVLAALTPTLATPGVRRLWNIAPDNYRITRARMNALGVDPLDPLPSLRDYVSYGLDPASFDGGVLHLSDMQALDEAIFGASRAPLGNDEIQYMNDLCDLDLGLAEVAVARS
jgi:hypothetical protein